MRRPWSKEANTRGRGEDLESMRAAASGLGREDGYAAMAVEADRFRDINKSAGISRPFPNHRNIPFWERTSGCRTLVKSESAILTTPLKGK